MVRAAIAVARSASDDDLLIRKIGAVLQAVIVALLFWFGYTVQQLKESAIRAEERDVQKTREIVELKTDLNALKLQVITAATAAASAASAAAAAAAAASNVPRR